MQEKVNHKVQGRADWSNRLPIKQGRSVKLIAAERSQTVDVAKSIIAESRYLEERSFFEPYARQGMGNTPFVFFGDAGEIPLLADQGTGPFEYRLSILAGEGDLVIIGGQRNRDFENYLEHDLDLGRRSYLQVGQAFNGDAMPAPVRCLKEAGAYASLRTKIEKLGGATLVPHIATGTIWTLAREIGKDTGKPVNVAGPFPTLSNLTNNKLWFAQVACQLFGEDAVPTEVSAYGAAALAARVHSFAQGCRKLVIKIPDSAGSKGNFPIASSEILKMGMKELHHHLLELLAETKGQAHYPLMVQVWENNVLSSPSAQLWIPLPADGPPIVEGIYEQHVTGPEGYFSGASVARLPEEWNQKLAHGALMLGHVFQELGYFGRCSFDTVISGEDFRSAVLHWIECNGRWGGVSVPMTFLNRVFGGMPPPPHIIVHRSGLDLLYRSFVDGLEVLDDLLCHPGGTEGVIFMTPSGFEQETELHFLSLAATTAQATAQAKMVIQRLMDTD